MGKAKLPLITVVNTYVSYAILGIVCNIVDMISYIFRYKDHPCRFEDGYAPIFGRRESIYVRRLYAKILDCFDTPITGYPSKYFNVLERRFAGEKLVLTGRTLKFLNIASYNYLGLSAADSAVTKKVIASVDALPISTPGSVADIGTCGIVRTLEAEFADFLGQEDCVVFPMGFATNSCTIPVFTDDGDLIVSDEYNHSSIIYGARLSKATIVRFAHNDTHELEKSLRYWISQGQPITHRTWKRVFVIVEGIYSMEGSILNLKEIVRLKRKYKFYLFIDEAHSIGAIGETGRGVCEYAGVDFRDVDMLMGTFTKSFNGAGGYIAGSHSIVGFLRARSDSTRYGEQMSPVVAAQVLESLRFLKSAEGAKLPGMLRRNARYMRKRLGELGYVVHGSADSPVIAVMIVSFGKIGEMSRLCREKGLAVVVVGYPATRMLESRLRLCISATYTKKDIDVALAIVDDAGRALGMDMLRKKRFFGLL